MLHFQPAGYLVRFPQRRVALSLALSGLLAACGGSGGAPPPQTATFERIQTEVFDVSCSSDSCHSSVGQAGGLVLEAGHSWDALMDQPPSNPAAVNHGMSRVAPGDIAHSFLLAKLTNNLAAGEGLPMPYNAAPLDPETIEVLEAWVTAGAPSTGVVPGDDGRALGGSVDDPTVIDLPPPPRGIQLKVTARPVERGKEETLCHYLKMPADGDIDINRIQLNVSGGSHHIHLYRAYDSATDRPDGFEVCNMAVDFDVWSLVIASQVRKTDWELPEGVAFHLKAGEQLLVQTHFVNVGSLETEGEGKVVMNLHDADPGSITAYAGSVFGQDKDVVVPPLTNTTLAAECVFPKPITVFAETGHYHFRGKRFSTFRWDGSQGEEIYHHEGYADPLFLVHSPPLDFAEGQGLQWECFWENPNDIEYKFGPFTDINEHCNFFAFYYPTTTPDESITCVKSGGTSVTTVRAGD
ncbi:MAG: hypothetical protein ACRERC_17315 [Candidatus Binatia bacterium]